MPAYDLPTWVLKSKSVVSFVYEIHAWQVNWLYESSELLKTKELHESLFDLFT